MKLNNKQCPYDGIGRHNRFRICWNYFRTCSSQVRGTIWVVGRVWLIATVLKTVEHRNMFRVFKSHTTRQFIPRCSHGDHQLNAYSSSQLVRECCSNQSTGCQFFKQAFTRVMMTIVQYTFEGFFKNWKMTEWL